ncbi:MAG: hypothetical protein QOK15_2373 [Nocardioidaceae bacterium]|jgi:glycosyltransferase involved in cell wall biosynthesis|nr:hypothetical protein [Nocardioidaceae bacterium]
MGRGADVAALASGLVVADQVRRAHARAARRRAAAPQRDAAVTSALREATTPDEPFVAIVIAAWNEAASLPGVLDALPRRLSGLDVRAIVVDDGSTDETALLAAKGGAVVARHPTNLGQGDGLRTGFALALALGSTVVVTMDADGQHDPGELPALVGPVVADEADYVQGSRFLGRYDDARGARHAGIVGFTALINRLAGTRITDCTNGFRAIRASGLARMNLVEDRFSASEIIIQAAAGGLRMLEVPVHIRSRDSGTSKKPKGLGYPLGYLGVILRSAARRGRGHP